MVRRSAVTLLVLSAAGGASPSARAAERPDERPAAADLAALVDEALANRPEVAGARADVRAARERVPQAGAWPEPMVQASIQNDGFTRWSVGTMETSWVSLMASQTVPFPGRPGLRSALAATEAEEREWREARVRLDVAAEVRRACLDLRAAHERAALLASQRAIVEQSAAIARSRFATAQGAGADAMRADLELARLGRESELLAATIVVRGTALNRAIGRALDAPVPALPALGGVPFPTIPAPGPALAAFRAGSPELHLAEVAQSRARRALALADTGVLPDVSVSAGVMGRGPLEPMWLLAVGAPLPLSASSRQYPAVAEARAGLEGAEALQATLDRLAELRVRQAGEVLGALERQFRITTDRLVPDAVAVSTATRLQYQVGAVPFAAVLEADGAAIEARDAALGLLVESSRILIAFESRSLDEPGLPAVSIASQMSPARAMGADGGARSMTRPPLPMTAPSPNPGTSGGMGP